MVFAHSIDNRFVLQALKEQLKLVQQTSQTASASQEEVTKLQQQVRERDERISKMTSELQASHDGVRETGQQLASLQQQLQRMASQDARVHSMHEELDSKNKSIQVTPHINQCSKFVFIKIMSFSTFF